MARGSERPVHPEHDGLTVLQTPEDRTVSTSDAWKDATG